MRTVPDITEEALARLLRAAANARDLYKADQAHKQLLSSRHSHRRFLNNLAIEMFGKCGSPELAKSVFDSIPNPNVFSFNLIMSAYTQNGHLHYASQIFAHIPERDVVSWTTMIAAYAQSGDLPEARELFDRMPRRNLVSWNTMIAGYVQNNEDHNAAFLFHSMDQQGEPPNEFTFAIVLDAYGNLLDLHRGEFTHTRVLRLCISDVVIQTSLIIMYGKCGKITDARRVFDDSPQDDLVVLSSMLSAYAQNGHLQEAKSVFEMAPHLDPVLWTGMLTAYAQNGQLHQARRVFETMPHKNVVSWSAMISANAQHGEGKEAVKLFKLMDLEGIYPHRYTIGSLIDAGSAEPSLSEAKLIHSVIKENGFKLDVVICSALVNMYGKCGRLDLAREVFDAMDMRNAISWNTIITVYAESGHGFEAVQMFWEMLVEGIKPDVVTLCGALGACAHAGLLEDARYIFGVLLRDYGVGHTIENYTSMVYLLGKAGKLSEAEELIHVMPFEPREITWTTLLSACITQNDVERATRIGQCVLQCRPDNCGPYVLLSNVYT